MKTVYIIFTLRLHKQICIVYYISFQSNTVVKAFYENISSVVRIMLLGAFPVKHYIELYCIFDCSY